MISGIWGTTALPNALRRSTRLNKFKTFNITFSCFRIYAEDKPKVLLTTRSWRHRQTKIHTSLQSSFGMRINKRNITKK